MDKPQRVALLVTCLVDQIMPEVGLAAVRVLQRAGLAVDFPTAQTCCGQPFFNSGFRRQAADLAKRTVEIFEPYEYVVAPSGSCVAMIRSEYPHLLAEWPDWQRRAQRLASHTYELSEFLVQIMEWPQPSDGPDSAETAATGTAVSYHDSCHMLRLLGLHGEPRRALSASGCSLREMDVSDRCCGFGGLFSLRLPEVANAMTAEKLDQAARAGAPTLVSADPGCLMQMRGMLPDDSPVILKHLAVVLEEQTR